MRITHKGIMFGFVPVYLNMDDEDEPAIKVRHWSLEFVLDFAEGIYGLLIAAKLSSDPEFEPLYPMVVTGECGGEF